jgi:hypothetical protein
MILKIYMKCEPNEPIINLLKGALLKRNPHNYLGYYKGEES